MKAKVMEVIIDKKQTSKTKYIIEAALEYRPPLNISRNFFSEKKIKTTASIQESTVIHPAITCKKFHPGKTGSLFCTAGIPLCQDESFPCNRFNLGGSGMQKLKVH